MYWNYIKAITYCPVYGLTLTWDVLKWQWGQTTIQQQERLTLTWDVLKYSLSVAEHEANSININMRCIEIAKTIISL